MIRKRGGKWVIYSRKGRRLGSYKSKRKARKRLRQIEWHKHRRR